MRILNHRFPGLKVQTVYQLQYHNSSQASRYSFLHFFPETFKKLLEDISSLKGWEGHGPTW